MIRIFKTPEEIKAYLEDPNIREALRRATKRFAEGREKTIAEIGNFKEIRKKTREIKEKALEKTDELWTHIVATFHDRGATVLEAVDAKDACEKIYKALNGAPFLIKGKSITSEEIGLNSFLEAKKVEVIETDLGERIIQLKKEKSSHLIVPAIHNSKEEVASLFSQYFKEEIPPDPYIITKKVRADLRKYFFGCQSRVNRHQRDFRGSGAFYLMTNEGNGRLCATMPEVYITLTGYEKIVETMEDALWILKVLPRNSVGLRFGSYVSIFKAPFLWQKSRKWYVVVLDNGRKKALKDHVLHHALRCIRCGACMNVCPIYKVLSGLAFSHVYMGGIGVAWTAITESIEEAYKVATLCTGCGSCNEVCPVEIPISALVEEVRSRVENKHIIIEETASKIMVKRNRVFSSLAEAAKLTGLYPPKDSFTSRYHNPEGAIYLYVGCVIDQLMPEIAEETLKILDEIGVKAAVSREECCGLPAKVYGNKKEYTRLMLKNAKTYQDKPVLFLCDTCLSTFIEYDKGLTLLTLPELLLEKRARFVAKKPVKVALHIPCHLKIHEREASLIEFLETIEGIDLFRYSYERECCGGAGLYRYKLPEVSKAVFEERVGELLNNKIEVVVTTCPSCIEQFRENLKETGIEVLHLAQFLTKYTSCVSVASV